MPRRAAWLLFLSAAILSFLAIIKIAFTVSGLPDWLEPAALCALAIGAFLWALPNQPPTVP